MKSCSRENNHDKQNKMLRRFFPNRTATSWQCKYYYSQSSHHSGNNNYQQVTTLFNNGKQSEAINEYFKRPHPASASFLIPKTSFEHAIKIYKVLKEQSKLNLFVTNSLLTTMRRKKQINHKLTNELLDNAMELFNSNKERETLKSLDMLMYELSYTGRIRDALLVFRYLKQKNFTFDSRSITNILKCSTISIDVALEIFNSISEPDLFHYGCLMKIYTKQNKLDEAIKLLNRMDEAGIRADNVIYTTLLLACSVEKNLQVGQLIHNRITKNINDIQLLNTLIHMYGQCGNLEQALSTFNAIPISKRNRFTWTCIVDAYIQNCGENENVKRLFDEMKQLGITLDDASVNNLLNTCAEKSNLEIGRFIHKEIKQQNNIILQNSLIKLYGKCGNLDEALAVFNTIPAKNIITWNCMIAAYINSNNLNHVFELVTQMERSGVNPDNTTYTSIITACADQLNLNLGRMIHQHMKNNKQFVPDTQVKNSLINMYGKCNSLEDAEKIFNSIDLLNRNSVTWTCMIVGYINAKELKTALQLIEEMHSKTNIVGDHSLFIAFLMQCAASSGIESGRRMHSLLKKHVHLISDINILNNLINMYGKCGQVQKAANLFQQIPLTQRTLVTWNTMINIYAQHGMGKEALNVYEQMKPYHKPDNVTFISLLNACSHSGLVTEALDLYESMHREYNIEANIMHITCIVDALGRAGRAYEANSFISKQGVELNIVTLTTLLGACRNQKDVVLAEEIFCKIMELDPREASAYVLMANTYALAGDYRNSNNMRNIMKVNGIKKIPGVTEIEINGTVHTFYVEDHTHPQHKEIREYLDQVIERLMKSGYQPDPRWVTRDVEDLKEKEKLVCLHSEKIALAYGLMMTDPGTEITITKNLRVCGDCHHATKFIAKEYQRSIVVRDANRFHHFTPDGHCSCGDYW